MSLLLSTKSVSADNTGALTPTSVPRPHPASGEVARGDICGLFCHPATRPSQLRPGDTFSGDHSSFQLNSTTLLFVHPTHPRLRSENAQPAPARKLAPRHVRLRSINNGWLAASDKVTLTPEHLSGEREACKDVRGVLHPAQRRGERRLITERARPAPGGDGHQCRPGTAPASLHRLPSA